MMREKQIYEHKHNRPILDQGAAKRFVRAGLYDSKKDKDRMQHNQNDSAPPNKKIKFDA